MADIRVNREELYQFGQNLSTMAKELLSNYNLLKAQAQRVGETWQDSRSEEFMEEFDSSTEMISKLSDMMESHANYIFKKAAFLQDY